MPDRLQVQESELTAPPTEIWVWPCDHGGVQVEYGPVPSNYPCHECGATSSKYVLAREALDG